MFLQLIVGQLFTYLLAPLALFLGLAALTSARRETAGLLFVLAFGFAPPLISRILIWLFYLFPGRTDGFYATVIVAAFVLLALLGRRALPLLTGSLMYAGQRLRAHAATIALGGGLATALIAATLSQPGRTWLSATLARSYGSWNIVGTGINGILPPVALAILAAFLATLLVPALSGARPLRAAERTSHAVNTILAALLATSATVTAILLFGQPIHENDAMQYFKVANLLHDAHSTAGYPVLPAAPDGTYASSSHPLGHYGVLIWGYMTAGKSAPFPGKLWSFYSFLVTLGGIWFTLRRFGATVVLAAMLLLATTPAYVLQVIGAGIDPQRLLLLFVASIALVGAAQTGRPLLLMLAGIGAGLALQAHVQELLLVPIAVGIAAFLMPLPLAQRVLAGAGALIIAFGVGGEQYFLNFSRFGTPVYNDHAIWRDVPALKYREWRLGIAPRTDFIGRLGSGAFLGFSWWYFFGLGWWLAAIAMLVRSRAILTDRNLTAQAMLICASLASLVIFYGFTASGEALVLNYRYTMAIQPSIAVMAGLGVGGVLAPALGWPALLRSLSATVVLSFATLHGLAVQVPQLHYVSAIGIGGTQYDELDAMPVHPYPSHLSEVDVIKELRNRTPPDAVFAVFNMNAFAYYADRRFVRDVDPRMVPFYRAADTEAAAGALRHLGVGYVYLQPWSWPTIDNSRIRDVVSDPRYATLVFEKHGYRIFRLAAVR